MAEQERALAHEITADAQRRADRTRQRAERDAQKIISDASMTLGEYDFMFEWTEKPSMKKIQGLIEKIDGALGELGVHYSLTTE